MQLLRLKVTKFRCIMDKVIKKTTVSGIKQKLDIQTYCCFAMLFIYGALLLMVGYTQGGLSKALFPNDGNAGGNMVYLLVAQSVGLIAATLITSKLLSKINIRYIFLAGYGIAATMLILISQITHFGSGTTLVVLFIVFSFILGCGIGPMSPLVSTFISAKYQGAQQATLLSVSNGVYGIGAGIIPLAASSFVYKVGNEGFSDVQMFYYIACGLAVLGAIVGWFIKYQHSAQLTSSKIIEKGEKSFSIWKPLIMALIIMSFYMVAETISNYMFTNIAKSEASKGSSTISENIAITAAQAFGLFVMIQGVWRAISGLFIVNRMPKSWFIVASGIVFAIAFVVMFTGEMQYSWAQYLVAILLGFGIGNLWPMIYGYSIEIDQRRASFIGMSINIVSMFWIPVTQLILAPIWSDGSKTDNFHTALYFAPIIIGIISVAGLVLLTIFSIFFYNNFRKQQNIQK